MKKILTSILFFCLSNALAAEIQMEDVLFNSKGVNLSGPLVYPAYEAWSPLYFFE